jgi:hypothetical protein
MFNLHFFLPVLLPSRLTLFFCLLLQEFIEFIIRYFLIAESHGGHGAFNFLPLTTIGPLNQILAREYSGFFFGEPIDPSK